MKRGVYRVLGYFLTNNDPLKSTHKFGDTKTDRSKHGNLDALKGCSSHRKRRFFKIFRALSCIVFQNLHETRSTRGKFKNKDSASITQSENNETDTFSRAYLSLKLIERQISTADSQADMLMCSLFYSLSLACIIADVLNVGSAGTSSCVKPIVSSVNLIAPRNHGGASRVNGRHSNVTDCWFVAIQ